MDQDCLTNVLMVKEVEVLDPTNMGIITTTRKVTVTMIAINSMGTIMGITETTRVDKKVTIVEMAMGISQQRETSVRFNVSSARKLGTMQINAQKIRLM